MATVSKPHTTFNRDETQRQIRHPLHSLRGYIRSYVLLEGIAVAVMFVAACFWAMLVFDFGLFELFMFDWIKQLDLVDAGTAFWLRASVLGAFVVGLLGVVAFMVLRRLFTEFSDASLALVLERRFPHQLGDRLITAVELAQPDVAEKYGFSQEMVDHTVKAAAQRVEKLPVSQVFNWRRLWGQWLLALGLSVGVWVGIMVGFTGVQAASAASFSDLFNNFTRTNTILAKRNVLLMERVYWPTRSYIEIVRFQDSPDHPNVMKVGRDEQRPDVKARAFEYVVYDPATVDSVRPLLFGDLQNWVEPALMSVSLPEDWDHWIMEVDDLSGMVSGHIIPIEWDGATAGKIREDLKNENLRNTLKLAGALEAVEEWLDWRTWPVDRIKQQLERSEVRQPMREEHADKLKQLEALLEEVDVLAASTWSNWNIRKLKTPGYIYLHYRGKQKKGDSAHERRGDNRYLIGLNELTESVYFWVQGENYFTTKKYIELVPPPSFEQLLATKHEPAYIYYWLQDQQGPLKGQKQLFLNQSVSLSGPISRLTPQPLIGSDLKLTAVANRKLKDGISIVKPDQPKIEGALLPENGVYLESDKKTFYIEIKDIRRPYEFEFRFSDENNVKGKRHIIIEPVIDLPPQEKDDLRLAGPLRKPRMKGLTTASGSAAGFMDAYLITHDAIIPFKGTMTDDYGLTKMEWFYEYEVVDFELITEEDLSRQPDKTKETTPFLSGPLRRASYVISGFQLLPVPLAPNPAAPHYWTFMGPLVEADLKASKSDLVQRSERMVDFKRRMEALNLKGVHSDNLQKMLTGKAPTPILPKAHSLDSEDGFDVGEWLSHKIKVDDASKEAQLHYRLRVYMAATDNNIEADAPGYTPSKVPVTFLIISEKELLAQILIEEEMLRSQLEKTLAKLRDAKTLLEGEIAKFRSPSPPLDVMEHRFRDGILDPVQEKSNTAQEVLGSFRRIHTEMKINRIDKIKTPSGYRTRDEQNRVHEMEDRIIRPLDNITEANTGNFAVTQDAVDIALRGVEEHLAAVKNEKDEGKINLLMEERRPIHLENAQAAHKKLDELIVELDKVLDAIGGEINWTRLVTEVRELERQQRDRIFQPLRLAHEEFLKKLLEDLGGLE